MDEQAQIELRGSVEDVTFYRPDTGFTVLDLNSEGELVTVVGVLPALSAGGRAAADGALGCARLLRPPIPRRAL